ncbi:MAG: hypothetical protein OJF49_000292 [Ktedonobacterales bacterium]|nr:MAG: hypothetical protein OJF49_000292 [Ktedonobacterales bacterium]
MFAHLTCASAAPNTAPSARIAATAATSLVGGGIPAAHAQYPLLLCVDTLPGPLGAAELPHAATLSATTTASVRTQSQRVTLMRADIVPSS